MSGYKLLGRKPSKKRISQIKILKTLHINVQAGDVASFIVVFLLHNLRL